MPVSHEKKSIFVHIPKCAGSSIESVLGMHGDIDYIGLKPYLNQELNKDTLFGKGARHYTVMQLKDFLSGYVFDTYFKFSIVRNPWDRFVSHVAWSKGIWDERNVLTKSDVDIALENLKRTNDENLNNHLQHQWKYLCDDSGNILCDYVGKFENLAHDWSIVSKKLGVESTLPKRMVSHREHYSKYLDDEQADFLANFYKQDITLFEYEFERL